MDSNLNLSIGFKGQLKLNAQAVPLQEGYLKIGGYVDTTETNGLTFGVVVSVDPDTPDAFVKGCPSGNLVRGICVFDDAIAQNVSVFAQISLTVYNLNVELFQVILNISL